MVEVDQRDVEALGEAVVAVDAEDLIRFAPGVAGAFAPFVDLYCCDRDKKVTVELRVTDESDNSNKCWLHIWVEDNSRPICENLPDVKIDCDEVPSDPTDTDYWQWFVGPPPDGFDNCDLEIVEIEPIVELDACGVGIITRRFQASGTSAKDGSGSNFCTQKVIVKEAHNYWIKFPADIETEDCVPGETGLEFEEPGCDLLAVSTREESFTAGASACKKILRTYRVINWCEYEENSMCANDPYIIGRDEDRDGDKGDEMVVLHRRSVYDALEDDYKRVVFIDRDIDPFNSNPPSSQLDNCHDGKKGYWRSLSLYEYGFNEQSCGTDDKAGIKLNGEFCSVPDNDRYARGFWQYTQIIKVIDNQNPTLTVKNESLEFNSQDIPTEHDPVCTGSVHLEFELTDNCTLDPDDLTVEKIILEAFLSEQILIFNKIEGGVTAAGEDFNLQLVKTGAHFKLWGDFPIGEHAFIIKVNDGCGNTGSVKVKFEVVDNKAPGLICIDGLAVELMPVDEDGDGITENQAMTVWATDYLAPSQLKDCTGPVEYFLADNEIDARDPNYRERALTLRCEDMNLQFVYVIAEDQLGNRDFCIASISVQDNLFPCDQEGNPGYVDVAGLITTEADEPVEGVEVSISGAMSESMNTTNTGSYEFDQIPMNHDYSVFPNKDVDPLNGVTTFDLILITKHILNVDRLDSPYQMIAADVNKSGTISTLDLIHLRKLILHVDREFRNNTSWRFIKADYTFPDPSDPWKEDFPEILNLNDLEKDMMTGDFIGVKIGDVNYSAIGYVRNAQGTFAFDLEETSMQTGGMYELTFRASDLDKLQGYQMALQWDTDAVELSDIRYALAQEEHFGFRYLDEGVLLNSWDGEASADEELFTLVFQANADVRLSEVLKVQSRYLQSEAYGLNGETLDIDLTFGGLAVEKRFHLYQNAPNPFSNETVIGFELPETASVTLTVFDASGRVLYLLNGDYAGGYNAVTINRDNLPASGVLYYRLETGDHAAMRKMIILE